MLPLNTKHFRPARLIQARFAPGKLRRKLPFPAAPGMHIAHIGAAVSSFDAVEPFSCDRLDDLEQFRPRVLIGSTADLLRMAGFTKRHAIDLSTVDHALFVLTRCGDQPLTDISRVVLWQCFGVPLYELFLGDRNMVLAFECEAHDGWHVENGAAFSELDGEMVVEAPGLSGPTGFTADLADQSCSCGRQGLRLINIQALSPVSASKVFAAIA